MLKIKTISIILILTILVVLASYFLSICYPCRYYLNPQNSTQNLSTDEIVLHTQDLQPLIESIPDLSYYPKEILNSKILMQSDRGRTYTKIIKNKQIDYISSKNIHNQNKPLPIKIEISEITNSVKSIIHSAKNGNNVKYIELFPNENLPNWNLAAVFMGEENQSLDEYVQIYVFNINHPNETLMYLDSGILYGWYSD